jgi:cytosine/adenosine deaminase-related metal-dependent hydrolase/C-terminal processing protease CtpA/Prc
MVTAKKAAKSAAGPVDPLAGPRLVVDGRIVTLDAQSRVLDSGRIYIDGGLIRAVQDAGAPPPPGFDGAPLLKTGGTVYPGMIELHNHLSYNVLPLWQVPRKFGNRAQWANHADKRRLISGPMKVLGSADGILESVVRYVEAKCLVAGVTTSQGVTLVNNAGILRMYRGIVRNVEATGDKALPAADTRIADVEAGTAEAFLKRLQKGKRLLLHLAEGIDDTARRTFEALRVSGSKFAITEALLGIHGAGLRDTDFDRMADGQGSIVWSPLSNLLLYGGTLDIKRAKQAGVRLSLGSDWSPSGSKNLLGELKVASIWSAEAGGVFSAQELVRMATTEPAQMLGWGAELGSIEAGKRADLMAIDGKGGDPYQALVKARETSIVLVTINGMPRYGMAKFITPFTTKGEAINVGTSARMLNFEQATADPIVGALTLAQATTRLKDAMLRLPQIAVGLANPLWRASLPAAERARLPALGVTRPGLPGVWTLELDNDPLPGTTIRPLSGHDPMLDAALNEADSQTLGALALDPLTVADDDDYFQRLANQANLPDVIKQKLAPLYGAKAPKPGTGVLLRASLGSDMENARTPTLAEYREVVAQRPDLTLAERLLIVRQAQFVIEQAYVHLPLKRAAHAVNPRQRLRLLENRLQAQGAMPMDDVEFHGEMTSIFAGLRDLHTSYLLPTPYREHTAYVPFLLDECFDPPAAGAAPGAPRVARYLVTRVHADFAHPDFRPGVEVLYWNGMPIRRAIEVNADRQAGSNPDARFAQGLVTLTVRPMLRMAPPDEDWVQILYVGLDDKRREIRVPWRVFAPGLDDPLPVSKQHAASWATSLGVDLQTEMVGRSRRDLFAPKFLLAERRARAADAPDTGADDVKPTRLPTVFAAREVTTKRGTFGLIRIYTFSVSDADEFIDEFIRLLGELPQKGLIVDVRGNGGGLIHAAEGLLQLLTRRRIEPQRAQLVTTPLALDLVRRNRPSPHFSDLDLGLWEQSIEQAVQTGAPYSNGFPITPEAFANSRGRHYPGPVVLVTDALCYSATDMFAAGFADHAIGPILGVAGNTGAGGANVWTHELLTLLMSSPGGVGANFAVNPFVKLPHDTGISVAIRRTLRVGDQAGTPVEDLGIEPTERWWLTRDDVLRGNRDLIERAGELLAKRR